MVGIATTRAISTICGTATARAKPTICGIATAAAAHAITATTRDVTGWRVELDRGRQRQLPVRGQLVALVRWLGHRVWWRSVLWLGVGTGDRLVLALDD